MIMWIPAAVGGALLLAGIVGLLVAAVLGEVGRRVSELDDELWAAMPVAAAPRHA